MHEARVGAPGECHDGGVYAVGPQQRDALRPHVRRLTHRHPHVGVDELGARDPLGRILGHRESRTRVVSARLGGLADLAGGPQSFGSHDAHIRTHHRAGNEQ